MLIRFDRSPPAPFYSRREGWRAKQREEWIGSPKRWTRYFVDGYSFNDGRRCPLWWWMLLLQEYVIPLYSDGEWRRETDEDRSTILAVFRLIMFRPFIGEAFLGKVVSSSPSGLTGAFCFTIESLFSAKRRLREWPGEIVSVGFFDDILVPFALLPDGCYL